MDNWALKANLQSYYEQDWAEMARVLQRNWRKLYWLTEEEIAIIEK